MGLEVGAIASVRVPCWWAPAACGWPNTDERSLCRSHAALPPCHRHSAAADVAAGLHQLPAAAAACQARCHLPHQDVQRGEGGGSATSDVLWHTTFLASYAKLPLVLPNDTVCLLIHSAACLR